MDLTAIIRANRDGGPAVPSVCSAHGDVLTAALMLAESLDRPLLIEATSNQVNHRGGYTGMRPSDFVADVRRRADAAGCGMDRVIFGGDHLGPQAWKAQPPKAAMDEARAMIAAYVEAGFTKIHIDCAEGCAGEPDHLTDGPAAARAVELARVAEKAAREPLSYVVGTEVPPPGGARGEEEAAAPTAPERAEATLAAHEAAFRAHGLPWDRVRGLVLQPGLEFGPTRIDHLDLAAPDRLSPLLDDRPGFCFEAHSTDYQRPEAYAELARRRFAILKVGPALTFAWREALYALSHVVGWTAGGPHVSAAMEGIMLADPGAWRGHYAGSEDRQRVLRHFGYADRIRYYWAGPKAMEAVRRVVDAFDAANPPRPLLAQYLPAATLDRAEALEPPPAKAILIAHVQEALAPYFATGANASC